jgi:predicted Zn-dependent peptidase
LINKKTLKNGITLMSEYLPYVQSTAVGVWALAGAVDENLICNSDDCSLSGVNAQGDEDVPSGISHLIEHMLFKGTRSRSARDIAEEIDSMGSVMNAFTGKETTCYYIKALSEHLGDAIELLGDIFLNSRFDYVELDKEKNVIYEEMNMIEDSPDDYGHDLLMEAVFAGSSLGNRIIGYKDTLKIANTTAIRRYMSWRYTAGNVVISVAGNFAEDELAAHVESAFGNVPRGLRGRDSTLVAHSPAFVSRARDIEQSHIFLGKRGVDLSSDDYYAFSLFNSILGGSMSSRLFQSIREEKGLAYSVYSTGNSFVDDGIFMIYAAVGDGNERVAIDAIRNEVRLFASQGVGADELAKAKEQSKGVYVFGRENIQTRMFSTGKNELLLSKVFEPEEIIAGIDAVTMDDIVRIARRYADLADYSAVVIGKKEMEKKALGL